MAEDPEAHGEVWHIPEEKPVTEREFITMIFEALGEEPQLKVLGRRMMSFLGFFVPTVKELKELVYEWERLFVIDGTKFRTRYDLTATPHK